MNRYSDIIIRLYINNIIITELVAIDFRAPHVQLLLYYYFNDVNTHKYCTYLGGGTYIYILLCL